MADYNEKLVVWLTGDSSEYRRMLKEAESETASSSKKIEKELQAPEHATHRLSLGMRDTRHAIHILGATTGLEGVTRPAMMGVYAYHLMEHAVMGTVKSVGALNVALAGTTIGLAIAAVSLLVHQHEKLAEEAKAIGEASTKAFSEASKEAENLQTTLSGIQTDILTKGFEEAIGKAAAGPGFFGTWGQQFAERFDETKTESNVAADNLENDLLRVMKRAFEAQEAYDHLIKTEAGRFAQQEITISFVRHALDKEAEGLEGEIYLNKKATDERKAYAEVFRLMQLGFTEAQAINLAKEQFDRAKKATEEKRAIDQAMQEAEIEHQTKLLTMTKAEAEQAKLIFEYRTKKHPGASEAEAKTVLAPVLKATDAKSFQTVVTDVQHELDKMNDELWKVGMTKEEAFAADTIDKFIRAYGPLNEAQQKTVDFLIKEGQHQMMMKEGAELVEKAKTPQEKYAKALEHINDLYKSKAIPTQEEYNRIVAMTQKEILGAAQATEKFDAATAGSAEGISRFQEFQSRFLGTPGASGEILGPGAAVTTGSAAGESRKDANTSILMQIRNILDAQAKRGVTQLVPSDFGGGGAF